MSEYPLLSDVQIHIDPDRIHGYAADHCTDLPDPTQRLIEAWFKLDQPEVISPPMFEQLRNVACLTSFEVALAVASLISNGFVATVEQLKPIVPRSAA